MRIGFDAHILTPEHHKHHAEIAQYTRELLRALLRVDRENTYIVFLDARTPPAEAEEFAGRPNVEIKHFPFAQYRAYLPFVYAHMLVSAFLTAARLDVFHSPEGLIPYLYPGKIVTTFHWVPLGERGTNIFMRTWMLGARMGFAALAWRAHRVLLRREGDKALLCTVHHFPAERAVVTHCEDFSDLDWDGHARQILGVYQDLAPQRRGLLGGLPRIGAQRLVRRLPRPRLPKLRRRRKIQE